MSRFCFLDSWVLSEYRRAPARGLLIDLLADQGLTAVINSLSLVEIFNPGWLGARSSERGEEVAELLSRIAFVIVDPVEVVRQELMSFPESLPSLPVKLRSEDFRWDVKDIFLRFLRSDEVFLAQGKNVAEWADSWRDVKKGWGVSVEEILSHAVSNRLLNLVGTDHVYADTGAREKFLQSLDLRLLSWLSSEERTGLGEAVVYLVLGGTAKLPAVRLSSLLFADAYVDVGHSARRKMSASDLGDFFHLMIAPYCEVATVDHAMESVLRKSLAEIGRKCSVLNPSALKRILDG